MQKKYSIFFGCLIAILLIAKFVFIFSHVMPRDDDLYYWLWFQHPFFSYPDHPPLIGYLVGISTLIFGNYSFAISIGGVIILSILAGLGYFLAANLFVPRSRLAGFLFATSIATVPYFAGISVIMAPDTVSVFFAFLALFAYHNAFFRQENCARAWIFAGIFLGLAFFSKLTTFFLGLAIFFYALASKNRKKYLRNPYFYLSFVPSIIVGIILLISDSSHDWIMLKYSSVRANNLDGEHLTTVIRFLSNQFLHYSPLFFATGLIFPLMIIWRYYKNKPNSSPNTKVIGREEAYFFFGFLALFCWLIVVWSLTKTRMLNHWSGFFILPANLLTILYGVSLFSRPWFRRIVVANFVFVTIYCSLIVFHTIYGTLDYRYDETRNDPFRQYNIFLKKIAVWIYEKTGKPPQENGDWLFTYATLKETTPGSFLDHYHKNMRKDLPIIASDFRPAAYLKFYLNDLNPAPTIIGLTNHNLSPHGIAPIGDTYSMYDMLVDYQDFLGKDAYFLIRQNSLPKGEAWIRKNFAEVEKLQSFLSQRKGRTVATYVLYLVKNYQPSKE